MDIQNNQEQLMKMIVDKVFDKHKVKVEQNNLTSEEKNEMKKVVDSIKKDVEKFLENQTKTKTEKDFPNQSANTNYTPTQQPSRRKKSSFAQPNDINAVKNFISKKKF